MSDGRMNAMASNSIRFNNSEIVSRLSDKNHSKKEQNQSDRDNEQEEKPKHEEFIDRSAQLNASLNSLAMMNIAKININKPSYSNHINPFLLPNE